MKSQFKGCLKIHTAAGGFLWIGESLRAFFLNRVHDFRRRFETNCVCAGLIPLDEKLSGAAVKRGRTIIISNPAKKTCKKLWISIKTGLMERWRNVMTRLVTKLSNYLKLLNRIPWKQCNLLSIYVSI
jgi:hypothetical protein